MEPILCLDAIPSFLGLFDFSVAPSLLFYSYIPILLISLFLGSYILVKDKYSLRSSLLFLIFLNFSLWVIAALVNWTGAHAKVVHFSWEIIALFEILIYVLSLYFLLVFLEKRDISFGGKLLLTLVSLPVIVFLPTTLNMSGFDLVACESANGYLWFYIYAFELISLLAIAVISLRKFLSLPPGNPVRKEAMILGVGFLVFLGMFTATNIYGDLFLLYEFNLIGPVGMAIFIVLLTFMIVRFKIFNIKLIGAQALVVALWFLIGSLLFVAQSTQTKVVAGVTLVLAIIGGYFLVKSVKKEVEQREEIAKLAETLAKANDRLKVLDKLKSEFVSIASHQLRSPLTAVRGYASMLVEGSYGKLPEKALEAATNIADSAKYMALSVEDYLNVSRIEAGNMKYEVSDFNLKDTAEKIVDELRPVALKKGLVMVFRSECSGSCSVHADVGKTRQVIMNLLDNSMKYTPKGTITVVAHDDVKKKKMYVSIQDTGVGMSKETQEEIFDKFVRAKNANNVNTTGTGLGLFVAKKMITDMGGKVWAESEGEGKGSTFHIELPLLPGKSMR